MMIQIPKTKQRKRHTLQPLFVFLFGIIQLIVDGPCNTICQTLYKIG